MQQLSSFFEHLLCLSHPFHISKMSDHLEYGTIKHVDIYIEVDSSYVPLNDKGQAGVRHDIEHRTWQHLHLFQYPCYLHCDVPKFRYPNGSTRTLSVPWARPGSGFSLLFESIIMYLIQTYGCVSRVARQLALNPNRVWTIFNHYADHSDYRLRTDYADVKELGYDETSKKKGHDYITIFFDMKEALLLDIIDGKSSATVAEFVDGAKEKGLIPELVTDVSIDMSTAFTASVKELFPNAEITYDKFHVTQLVSKAFDRSRKAIGKKTEKGSINKWLFFKVKLSRQEQEELDQLLLQNKELDQIYAHFKEFNQLWQQENLMQASTFLQYWIDKAETFKKRPMTTLAKTLQKHFNGIINYFKSHLTNALLEGFNNKIQAMKRTARGYRNTEILKKMIKIHCGKQIGIPTQSK